MNNMERLFEERDEALSNACMAPAGYEKQDIGAVTFGQGALALDFLFSQFDTDWITEIRSFSN